MAKKMKFYVVFSHRLTGSQISQIREFWQADMVSMPDHLANIWSQIPAEAAELSDYLHPIVEWLNQSATAGDYVLVQGDYGMTHAIVDYCFKHGLQPLYATSVRVHSEVGTPDGKVVMQKRFQHVIFRRYQPWRE